MGKYLVSGKLKEESWKVATEREFKICIVHPNFQFLVLRQNGKNRGNPHAFGQCSIAYFRQLLATYRIQNILLTNGASYFHSHGALFVNFFWEGGRYHDSCVSLSNLFFFFHFIVGRKSGLLRPRRRQRMDRDKRIAWEKVQQRHIQGTGDKGNERRQPSRSSLQIICGSVLIERLCSYLMKFTSKMFTMTKKSFLQRRFIAKVLLLTINLNEFHSTSKAIMEECETGEGIRSYVILAQSFISNW